MRSLLLLLLCIGWVVVRHGGLSFMLAILRSVPSFPCTANVAGAHEFEFEHNKQVNCVGLNEISMPGFGLASKRMLLKRMLLC